MCVAVDFSISELIRSFATEENWPAGANLDKLKTGLEQTKSGPVKQANQTLQTIEYRLTISDLI